MYSSNSINPLKSDLFEITVKTFFGLEEVLAKELIHFGVTDIKTGARNIVGKCDLTSFYRVAYNSRLALKILIPIHQFTAFNEKQLYQQVYNFDWYKYFSPLKTMAISTTIYSKYFTHSQYAGLKTKDAIVDFFRNDTGKRPDISTKSPQIALNVHAKDEHFTISLDVSYYSLHQRKYRHYKHTAPLNEVLAAGMIRLSGWRFEEPLIDPMCGTGTIPIEAAMMANNIPPRLHKNDWCLTHWKSFDKEIWEKIEEEAFEKIKKKKILIYGYDKNHEVIDNANSLIRRQKFIPLHLESRDFFHSENDFDKGVIITNPPYGLRIGEETDIELFYEKIGDKLKNSYAGWKAWILSGNLDAIKSVGLKRNKRIQLYNGSIDCQFNEYRIFKGNRIDYLKEDRR